MHWNTVFSYLKWKVLRGLESYRSATKQVEWLTDPENAESNILSFGGFHTLKAPLTVFKKVAGSDDRDESCIVELLLEPGTVVFSELSGYRRSERLSEISVNRHSGLTASALKMRASQATVVSVIKCSDLVRSTPQSRAIPEYRKRIARGPVVASYNNFWGRDYAVTTLRSHPSWSPRTTGTSARNWMSRDDQINKFIGPPVLHPIAYRCGTTVAPAQGFSYAQEQCEAGIHFFINLIDALEYDI